MITTPVHEKARLWDAPLASITIRNLDDDLKLRLRIRAAEHGRSMEGEARDILLRVMAETPPPRNLAAAIRGRFAALGGVELELPPREPMPEPPPLTCPPASRA